MIWRFQCLCVHISLAEKHLPNRYGNSYQFGDHALYYIFLNLFRLVHLWIFDVLDVAANRKKSSAFLWFNYDWREIPRSYYACLIGNYHFLFIHTSLVLTDTTRMHAYWKVSLFYVLEMPISTMYLLMCFLRSLVLLIPKRMKESRNCHTRFETNLN